MFSLILLMFSSSLLFFCFDTCFFLLHCPIVPLFFCFIHLGCRYSSQDYCLLTFFLRHWHCLLHSFWKLNTPGSSLKFGGSCQSLTFFLCSIFDSRVSCPSLSSNIDSSGWPCSNRSLFSGIDIPNWVFGQNAIPSFSFNVLFVELQCSFYARDSPEAPSRPVLQGGASQAQWYCYPGPNGSAQSIPQVRN